MKTQKAIVVRGNRDTSVIELNKWLNKGWKVVQSCPMPHDNYNLPSCIVIIEGFEDDGIPDDFDD